MQRYSVEIAMFSPGVTTREGDGIAGISNALGELDRGAAVFELLEPGAVIDVGALFPVDDASHGVVLDVGHAGRADLHLIPRGPTSAYQKDGGSLIPGGKVFPVTDTGTILAISRSEVGSQGRPTGRDRVYALVRVSEGPPARRR